MEKSNQSRIRAGVFLTLLGLFLGIISILPPEIIQGSLTIPRWLLFLLALLFGAASTLAFQNPDQRGSNLVAAVIFFILAIAGTWIAVSGSPASFSGGISTLPPQTNRTLGRIAFGTGAALNLGLGIIAARRYFRRGSPDSGNSPEE